MAAYAYARLARAHSRARTTTTGSLRLPFAALVTCLEGASPLLGQSVGVKGEALNSVGVHADPPDPGSEKKINARARETPAETKNFPPEGLLRVQVA